MRLRTDTVPQAVKPVDGPSTASVTFVVSAGSPFDEFLGQKAAEIIAVQVGLWVTSPMGTVRH